MLNHTVSTSAAFVVGDQKVCTLSTESFLALQQTFWNTNNGANQLTINLIFLLNLNTILINENVLDRNQNSIKNNFQLHLKLKLFFGFC